MTLFHERLRGSLHSDTAQERLDYRQGIYRGRTAEVALDEAKGVDSALGGIGPIPAASYGRAERYFDDLIAFARFKLKALACDAVSPATPVAAEAHIAVPSETAL